MSSLAEKTIVGIFWNFAEQLSQRGLQAAVTLLLAFFLTPEDFGLVALMAVFIAIASSLMDSGFKQALIRLRDATQTDFNTAFFANLVLGFVAYALLFFAAPFIAVFYDEPDLTHLVRVTGLVVVVTAFQLVQLAVLNRQLNFKAQLNATIPAAILSGVVALVVAYIGLGVWALVVQMLLSAFLITVFLWRIRIWRPSSSVSYNSLWSMFGFGYKMFLSGLLDTLFKNLYIIVIAKLFTVSVVGLYFFANRATELVLSQLVGAIQNVTYPALSTLQDDNARLKVGYRKVILVSTFLLFPVMALLVALAQPLCEVMLPKRWWPAEPYLQLLCLAGLLYPLHSINLNILKVKGRSDLFLYLEIGKKAMVVVILIISVNFGIYGILVGQIAASVLAYLPNSYFSAKLIAYPANEQMADFMPGLILSTLLGGLMYGAVLWLHWPAVVKLLVFGGGGSLLYLVGAHVFKLHAYTLIRGLAEQKLSRRNQS